MGDENDKRAVNLSIIGMAKSMQRNDTIVTLGILMLVLGILVVIIMIVGVLAALFGNMSI